MKHLYSIRSRTYSPLDKDRTTGQEGGKKYIIICLAEKLGIDKNLWWLLKNIFPDISGPDINLNLMEAFDF